MRDGDTVAVTAALAAYSTARHEGAPFEAAVAAAGERRRAALRRLERDDDTAHRIDAAVGPHDARILALALVHGARLADDPGFVDDAAPLAAALAAAAVWGSSARAIDEAIAVGIEVGERMRRALDGERFADDWNRASVPGIVGAAAAAARLAELDAESARDAIGIVATQAAGTAMTRGKAAGALACGKAASDAIEAVALARGGFTAPVAAIEGRRGLAALMAERFDPAAVVER